MGGRIFDHHSPLTWGNFRLENHQKRNMGGAVLINGAKAGSKMISAVVNVLGSNRVATGKAPVECASKALAAGKCPGRQRDAMDDKVRQHLKIQYDPSMERLRLLLCRTPYRRDMLKFQIAADANASLLRGSLYD
jgi:hypothetical protein